jgi:hypothetical protein
MSEVGAFVGIFAKNLHLWVSFAVGKVRHELHKLLTGGILTTITKTVCNKNGGKRFGSPGFRILYIVSSEKAKCFGNRMYNRPQVKGQGRFYSLENLGHVSTSIYASTIRFRSREFNTNIQNKCGNANEDQQLKQRWKPTN